MKKKIHDYLLSVDEVGHWEFPEGAQWDTMLKEVQPLIPALEDIVGTKLDVMEVQDASFPADFGGAGLAILPSRKTIRPNHLSFSYSLLEFWSHVHYP